ncbi:zinc finger HIT domain-containing protein 3 [Scomber scombrus]|uniref:Zinc finger HIT domain-containing protein 3 n=1 Tax=Scomber scombrus TaxID=13677 RepID=A0AAV1PMH2_SCOSC
MHLCSVCAEHTPKYRCPACKIRYCSLGCYKRHKEPWSVEDLLHEDDVTDKVPLQRLQLLGQSKELRDLLCNPHLRQLLQSIDSSDTKDNAMRAAMQEPLFGEFSDQCLKIVENQAQSVTNGDL